MKPKYKDIITDEKVTAIQFIGDFTELEEFVGGDAEQRGKQIVVATSNGPLWFSNWDYIVSHPPGMFAAYSPLEFAKRFKNI